MCSWEETSRTYTYDGRKVREDLPEKITLDRVFERPSEASEAEIEGGADDEVFLEKEIVYTNVQKLESL